MKNSMLHVKVGEEQWVRKQKLTEACPLFLPCSKLGVAQQGNQEAPWNSLIPVSTAQAEGCTHGGHHPSRGTHGVSLRQ